MAESRHELRSKLRNVMKRVAERPFDSPMEKDRRKLRYLRLALSGDQLFKDGATCDCGGRLGCWPCEDNGNGNRNRQYVKCDSCSFLCANDLDHCYVGNPLCGCGFPSRTQHQRFGSHHRNVCAFERGKCWVVLRRSPVYRHRRSSRRW
ncbi:hypothetical protein BO86DRAFT_120635 [Aspergillus japonicus CBS 114.51]|uniref:Uncharacterized protein n=1 Tax=Aspergillus japonicus CBS 114.51 TaxID=1448312 RepID=A0A8T8WYB1_ASPJA|nr:hypothetical protein BO86DRAFT_120635 [Aspergillus japonicus CBS 114.51]RAH80828.1 hypothetical protein BO86DRAFT_120635 [Aspergillus japonicus CBS 114.51]